MIRCANCGNNNPDDNNFCDQCGSRLITNPGNTESTKYANNPFESSNSKSSQEFNNPFGDSKNTKSTQRTNVNELHDGESIKRCSRCNGTGKIKEEVPSLFGKSYSYETCYKCHGIGKYIVDENGTYKRAFASQDTVSNRDGTTSDNSGIHSQHNEAATSKSNPQKKTQNKAVKIVVGIIIGYFVLFAFGSCLQGLMDYRSSKKTEQTTSASSSTITETSSKSTHETLSTSETATIYYKDLSFELPGDWLETPLYGDLVFRYGEKPGPDCDLKGYDYLYEDDPEDFEDARQILIDNYNYYVENGDYSSFEYEDLYIGDRQAIKLTYQSESHLYIEVYIDDGDGYIIFEFSIVDDYIDEFKPVVEGIIDSIKVVEPTSESTSSSSPDIEFTSYTYKDLTCEIPAGWVESTGDSNTDTINIYDNPDSAKYAIGFGFLEGDLSLSNEEVKAGLISANDGIYDVYENEDCKVGNHTAVKLTCINDEFVLIQYLIDADEGIVSIGFGYNSSDEATFEPIMDYILNSCSFETVEATTISETTEPSEEITLLEPIFNDVEIGDTVEFGMYEQDNDKSNGQEPIEWIVLDIDENGNLLLISKYVLDYMEYTEADDYSVYVETRWDASHIKYWLNYSFIDIAFSDEEQLRLVETKIGNDENSIYGTMTYNSYGKDYDKLFLLSIDEAELYFGNSGESTWGFYTSSSYALSKPTAYAVFHGSYAFDGGNAYWWLRTPGENLWEVAYIDDEGELNADGYTATDPLGVRPAMWIIP